MTFWETVAATILGGVAVTVIVASAKPLRRQAIAALRRLDARPVDPTVGDDAAAIERLAQEQLAAQEAAELQELHASGKAKVLLVEGSGPWSRVVTLSDGSRILYYEDYALRNRRAHESDPGPLEHRFAVHYPKEGVIVDVPKQARRG